MKLRILFQIIKFLINQKLTRIVEKWLSHIGEAEGGRAEGGYIMASEILEYSLTWMGILGDQEGPYPRPMASIARRRGVGLRPAQVVAPTS